MSLYAALGTTAMSIIITAIPVKPVVFHVSTTPVTVLHAHQHQAMTTSNLLPQTLASPFAPMDSMATHQTTSAMIVSTTPSQAHVF